MNIHSLFNKIIHREDLASNEMNEIMNVIMQGELTNAQLGAFLIGMRMKGESNEELLAATKVLRKLAVAVPIVGSHVVDIVGTGGDQANTFNISTASAFVVAAAGGCVAKHGNRSVSSHSGSADVLEAAGINLTLTPRQIADCAHQIGIGFMFAPLHHVAMKHVLQARKELGVRTFFNLIGPLTNPANAPYQLVGVFAKKWVEPIAEILQQLGSKHAMVVHAEDGLDEISINAPTFVAELKQGKITTYTLCPEQFGFNRVSLETIKVINVTESLHILQQVMQNNASPARDIVVLNSGAAIYVAGLAKDLAEGIAKAKHVISNGEAYAKFQALIALSQKLATFNH